METECVASDNVVSIKNPTSQVSYKIHPLVIMNISEHWTREKAQSKGKTVPTHIYGALMGVQDQRNVELLNSFAVKSEDGGNGYHVIDSEYFRTREAQYKEVFSELEFLGWYTTGENDPSEGDITIHRQFAQWAESPIFAKFDAVKAVSTTSRSAKLPISLYESVLSEATQQTVLRQVEWILVSEESERIGVDHVTRMGSQQKDIAQSEVAKQIRSISSAAEMLKKRLQVMTEYLSAVKDGRLPLNEVIVREANKVFQQLSLIAPDDLDRHLDTERLDTSTAMAVIDAAEMCGALNALVTKVNLLILDRPGMMGMQPPKYRGGGFSKKLDQPDLFNM